jgi:hypothetical protein
VNPIGGAGQIQGTQMSFSSFSVNGQFLSIEGTINAAGNSFTGTYQITGGCAGGATGTVSGTQYAALTGTYSGSRSGTAGSTIQLTLSQNQQGNGNGVFLITGSAQFTGFGCFTAGTLSADSGIITGSDVQLAFSATGESGTQIVLTGTIDTAADKFTVSSIQVNGGSCAGSYGTATLTRQ